MARCLEAIFRCGAPPDVHQFVMFGLEKAGKTTLLWRLKFPQWKRKDLIKETQQLSNSGTDPGYHYENFKGHPGYGIWDVPGSPVMQQLWPLFYRYVHISAVLFVVDASILDDGDPVQFKKIVQARQHIHHLLNEAELQGSAFVLIINDRDGAYENLDDDPLDSLLGIGAIMASEQHGRRFSRHCFDVSNLENGASSTQWQDVVNEIRKVMIAYQPHKKPPSQAGGAFHSSIATGP